MVHIVVLYICVHNGTYCSIVCVHNGTYCSIVYMCS